MSTPTDIERRYFTLHEVRVEKRVGRKGDRIIGHAAVFGMLSDDLGGFRERIEPGAFSDALATDDVRALFNHDPNMVLGRTKSGTLSLAEDERGLHMTIALPDTQLGRDLSVLVDRGDISQASFAFSVREEDQSWQREGDGTWTRTIRRIARLWDVSPVTFPAYPQTEAVLRALHDAERRHAIRSSSTSSRRNSAMSISDRIRSARARLHALQAEIARDEARASRRGSLPARSSAPARRKIVAQRRDPRGQFLWVSWFEIQSRRTGRACSLRYETRQQAEEALEDLAEFANRADLQIVGESRFFDPTNRTSVAAEAELRAWIIAEEK